MIIQDERKAFRIWLKRNTKLSDKAAGDVVSRLARIEKITPIHTQRSAEDFLFNLGKKAEYTELSRDVRSQLKRAYTFYCEFKRDK
jgi:hypothetical protein